MTLCIAWIRDAGESEELVFATDSALTGGERWNHGVKLFELPRTDCLLCFAGETHRAYPLILNAISAIKHDDELKNLTIDIQDVLYRIVDIFTTLVCSIFDKPSGDTSYIGGEAKFLFGGWSWKESRFRIWKIYYSSDVEGFLYEEETVGDRYRVAVFLGDPEDDKKNVTQEADKRYTELLLKSGKRDRKVDMEPLNILVDMCRDTNTREVDGSIQIGKIYKSGTTEFFGVMWESITGNPTFFGQPYNKHNKPKVRYIDPDSGQIIEDEIPKSLVNIEDFNGGPDYEFLKSCYSQDDNFLKSEITEKERVRLISIFREFSYAQFLLVAEENLHLKSSVPAENNGE